MPKDITTFGRTISYYLEEYASQIPVAFRQQYLQNMQIVVQHINQAIDNGLNLEILKGHIAYQNLNNLLENRNVEYYFKSMPDAELQLHLTSVIRRAYSNANINCGSEIETFIANEIANCQHHLITLVEQNYFTVYSVLEDLALFISNVLTNSGFIKYGHDVHNKFRENIQTELLSLMDYITVETKVDFCTHQICKFLNPEYVACLNHEYTRLGNLNPVYIIHNADFTFFAASSIHFNQVRLQQFENDFFSILAPHKFWLSNLSPGVTDEQAYAAICRNWEAKNAFYERVKSMAKQQTANYFSLWLTRDRQDLAPLNNELLLYKDQLIIRRASRALAHKIFKKVERFFEPPSFITTRRPAQKIAPNLVN